MTESKRAIHTDLAKLDAHEVMREEYEDIPELTDEFFDRAEIRRGDKLIRRGRGRPPLEVAKKADRVAPRSGCRRGVPGHRTWVAIAHQYGSERIS